MIVVGILVIIALIIVIRVIYELHTLDLVNYKIESNKLGEDEQKRIIFISDLHLRKYGKNNEKLISLIRSQYPDYIFIGGDMVTASKGKDDTSVHNLLEQLSEITAVYYALGNHEKKMQINSEDFNNRFEDLKSCCDKNGIKLLENNCVQLTEGISLYGLDLDFKYYKKFNIPNLNIEELKKYLGDLDKNVYNILLAHSPKYFELYEQMGFNLVLSGHYHGGAVGLGNGKGLISPQFRFFPKYCKGMFTKNNTSMIVTSGCGSHKVNLRLNNKPEVMVIDIYGHFI